MISGTAYGVVLNDRDERERMAGLFTQPPYGKAPEAAVLYVKPRNTFVRSGAVVAVPGEVTVASTLALLFGHRPGVPTAVALAADLSEPHTSFYRPAIAQRCRDGFLPIAPFTAWEKAPVNTEIVTSVDDREVHRWRLSRLVRDPISLMDEIGDFMTLADGDVLLIGLPGDAPTVRSGLKVAVTAEGFPPLTVRLAAESGG